jgi:two-component system NarL family sensor kinase
MQTPDQIRLFLIVTTVLILFLVALISVILFLYQKKRIAFMKHLETVKLDYEKNLLKTQLEIQEHTFDNISQEIHDNISLSLTLAKLNLNTVNINNKFLTTDAIENSVALISNAINGLSNISKSLNSEVISSHGLITALELEISKIKKCGKHEITFDVTGEPVFLEPQKELVLFRITQEALNNILKHANATSINLKLQYHPASVDLCVQDNGVGFSLSTTNKHEDTHMKAGLTNMRTRANLINGKCCIESILNSGTTILITAPV